MDDLHGFASERITQLAAARADNSINVDWLIRQLVDALTDLDALEPKRDAALEGREDF
ncbi:hypothetical protein BH10ACT4_BH10ACT4_08530 [soil metagenome]